VAHRLGEMGFDAAALRGGFNEWRKSYAVELVLSPV
jgi:hypothetical protein